MEKALVVVEATEASKDLIREAGELANGVGAELVLMHVTTNEEYQKKQDEFARITQIDSTYSVDQAKQGAKNFVNNIAQESLEGIDVDYEAVGIIGEKENTVISQAQKRNCDHIFIAGKKRSPTGKAIFGDDAQSVILKFNGPVTVMTE